MNFHLCNTFKPFLLPFLQARAHGRIMLTVMLIASQWNPYSGERSPYYGHK